MEFIELADYPLPGGHVVEWLPTAASHWADWPRDTRAVSHNHEQHLRDALEHNRIRERRHYWLGHAFRLDGALDAAAWRIALDQWIDRHEALRTHVTVEGGRPARYTAEPGVIRVRPVDAGTHASTMATFRLVQDLLDEGTSPLRWPSYVCVTIDGRRGCTVVLAADHSIMDGYSTTGIGGELRALYESARAGTAPALPAPGSYVDFSERERAVAATVTADDPGVALWREFLSSTANSDEADRTPVLSVVDPAPAAPDYARNGLRAEPASANGLAVLPGDDPFGRVAARPVAVGAPAPEATQRTLALELLDSRAADAAAALAREHGQSLFAVLLAAFAATTAEFGAGRDFRTVVPLHTRSEPCWAETLGWFVGLAPFALDTGGARTLAELVGPAGAELRRVRGAARVPFRHVCDVLEVRPRIAFMVSYMDIRAVPGAHAWADSETRWLRSRNRSGEEFFFWFLRTPSGVSLNMRYPGTTRATRDIHRHVLRMRELLTEFAVRGDVPVRPVEGAPLSWR
ncbi:condensation domain-containing protein [Nocardia puris]|uniref:Condensation domain-containing protein n=1 Tax=Nocardia puris TaxID=208602 RepID=A0A366DYP9_9NOCA|nr:condensation domain-containing protein [Nocardia puris]RBO94318.1 condensation domain-containing protein [Nocardia puris]